MARSREPVLPDDVFVFWTYDLFPYMLGAKVDMNKRKGSQYFVPSYDGWVKPFAVLDGQAGAQLIEDLEGMRASLRSEEDALKQRYKRNLKIRLKLADIDHPKADLLFKEK